MKKIAQIIGIIGVACACLIPVIETTGCAGATVSKTSVYQGDNFLFQAERLQVQAHQLFLTFYRWEKQWRTVLPVQVSRWADYCRLNEGKWMASIDAAHDAYVNSPSDAGKKDALTLALNEIQVALGQAGLYMVNSKATAPNSGISDTKTLSTLGVKLAAAPTAP